MYDLADSLADRNQLDGLLEHVYEKWPVEGKPTDVDGLMPLLALFLHRSSCLPSLVALAQWQVAFALIVVGCRAAHLAHSMGGPATLL